MVKFCRKIAVCSFLSKSYQKSLITNSFKSVFELFSQPRNLSDGTFIVSVAFNMYFLPLIFNIPVPSITKKITSNGFLCSSSFSSGFKRR